MSKPTLQSAVFELVGPNRGRTMLINGHQFVEGLMRLVEAPDTMDTVRRYMKRHGAFVKGTPEHAAAVALEQSSKAARQAAKEERRNGNANSTRRGSKRDPAAQVPGADGAAGKQAAPVRNDDGGGDAGCPAGGAGVVPDGGGPSDSGDASKSDEVSKDPNAKQPDEKLRGVVMALDHKNDANWTEEGLPAIEAVEAAYGNGNVTRADIEAAADNWTRKSAEAFADAVS